MSDAQKYADVFLAAAAGIAEGVLPRETYALWGDKATAPYLAIAHGWLASSAERPKDVHRLVMFEAYMGIGDLFAKIAEAERRSTEAPA